MELLRPTQSAPPRQHSPVPHPGAAGPKTVTACPASRLPLANADSESGLAAQRSLLARPQARTCSHPYHRVEKTSPRLPTCVPLRPALRLPHHTTPSRLVPVGSGRFRLFRLAEPGRVVSVPEILNPFISSMLSTQHSHFPTYRQSSARDRICLHKDPLYTTENNFVSLRFSPAGPPRSNVARMNPVWLNSDSYYRHPAGNRKTGLRPAHSRR